MSTLESKHEAKRTDLDAHGPGSSHWPHFGPYELAAVSAAQAHGFLVWLVVIAGLSGFRPEYVPGLITSWAVASANLTGHGPFDDDCAGWQRSPRRSR